VGCTSGHRSRQQLQLLNNRPPLHHKLSKVTELKLDAALEGKEDPLQNGSGMHQPTNQGGPSVPRAVDEVSLAVAHELAAASAAQIPGHSSLAAAQRQRC